MLLNKKLFVVVIFLIELIAQPLYEQQIVPFDGQNDTRFGVSTYHSDSLLIVGAIGWDGARGTVYNYKRINDNYSFLDKLFASDGDTFDLFGSSILYHKNRLFVGAVNKRIDNLLTGIGSVYVYNNTFGSWVEQQIIRPPNQEVRGSRFPSAMAAIDDFLIIGAEKYDTDNEEIGAVFVYKYKNDKYELFQEILPPESQEGQAFGSDIAIKDSLLLLASVADNSTSGIYSGSLYIYEREDSIWKFSDKIIPDSNSDFLGFGTSLAINDEYVFVGTSGIYGYNKPGKIYIYKYEGAKLELCQIIESGENYFNDKFGVSSAVQNDTLLVGALFDTTRTEITGSVYMFVEEEGVWKKKMKIVPSDPENANYFGSRLMFYRNEIFITAPQTYVDDMFYVGKVYRYTDFPTHIRDRAEQLTQSFALFQNYPNPFNPSTTIKFTISPEVNGELSLVKIIVHDILGREVATLINQKMQPGNHEVTFNANNLSSGIYFYKIDINGSYRAVKKMILLR